MQALHLAMEIKVLLQELEALCVSSPAREAGLAIVARGYACTSSLPKYEFLLLLFHRLGLVCPPQRLSLRKAREPQAHPRYLVVVFGLFLFNLRPGGSLWALKSYLRLSQASDPLWPLP